MGKDFENHSKKCQTGKCQVMMAYMYTGKNKCTSIHERLAIEMNRCLQETEITEWLTKVREKQIQIDTQKGTAPNNYRPITYLPMM